MPRGYRLGCRELLSLDRASFELLLLCEIDPAAADEIEAYGKFSPPSSSDRALLPAFGVLHPFFHLLLIEFHVFHPLLSSRHEFFDFFVFTSVNVRHVTAEKMRRVIFLKELRHI